MDSTAYFLVSHGSRDRRPAEAIAHLTQQLAQQLTSPIEAGVLELGDIPLHQQILNYSDRLISLGCNKLQILPLFLLQGVHVMEDIPKEVAIAQAKLTEQSLTEKFTIDVLPAIGNFFNEQSETTTTLIANLLQSVNHQSSSHPAGRILLSHGSRRAGGNAVVEAIAQSLDARPAYWSVQPDLVAQVNELVQQGHLDIIICLYFLFEGGITDSIRQMLADLKSQFPSVRFHTTPVLGESLGLVDLIQQSLTQANV
jgi:sirohydrochlorin cobaltochelatase